MADQLTQTWFLGANAPGGFTSLYSEFTNPGRGRLYILKGSPGSGKSTFMRAVSRKARKAGHVVEEILCSGDPESLDGVYIPDWNLGYVDGTAPHVIEPQCPGAAELYLNFTGFLDADALAKEKAAILQASAAYKAAYARAYLWIGAAHRVHTAACSPYHTPELLAAVQRRAQSCAGKLLRGKGADLETARYLSALTCQGQLTLWHTVDALAQRVCTLDNRKGLAPVFLEVLLQEGRKRGLSRILCPDPMEPGRLQHLIFPELSLAFVSVTTAQPYPGAVSRHFRLDAMVPQDAERAGRSAWRCSEKLARELLEHSTLALNEANRLHGELEAHYHPHMDFAALERFTKAHLAKLPK